MLLSGRWCRGRTIKCAETAEAGLLEGLVELCDTPNDTPCEPECTLLLSLCVLLICGGLGRDWAMTADIGRWRAGGRVSPAVTVEVLSLSLCRAVCVEASGVRENAVGAAEWRRGRMGGAVGMVGGLDCRRGEACGRGGRVTKLLLELFGLSGRGDRITDRLEGLDKGLGGREERGEDCGFDCGLATRRKGPDSGRVSA